jgi:hypothetical protein
MLTMVLAAAAMIAAVIAAVTGFGIASGGGP